MLGTRDAQNKSKGSGIVRHTDYPFIPASPRPAGTNGSSAPRSQSPFWAAVDAAEKITVRDPRRDQPEQYAKLVAAMALLDDDGRRNVVFQLRQRVIELGSSVQPVFAAGYLAMTEFTRPDGSKGTSNMVSVGHNAVAIRNAIDAGLTTDDMSDCGLAVLSETKEGKPRLNYPASKQAVVDAVAKLKELNRPHLEKAIEALQAYIDKGEELHEQAVRRSSTQATIARLLAERKQREAAAPVETDAPVA